MKIYVASSWRNTYQPEVVRQLLEKGYEVYDFKNPKPGDHGFHWSAIDPEWKNWTPRQYADALEHPVALAGFQSDMTALMEADLCVLVLPSGRSASFEYGWWCGAQAGFAGIVHVPEKCEPELMYLGSAFTTTIDELVVQVARFEREMLSRDSEESLQLSHMLAKKESQR